MLVINRLRPTQLFCLYGVVILSVGGCISRASAQAPPHPEAKTGEPVQPAALIAEDDIDPNQPLGTSFVINVSVVQEPEPSGNYLINGAGNILVHVAEVLTPISVRGLTCTEAATKITGFLKAFIRDAKVTVSIVSVPKPVVTVSGGVKKGGAVMISRRTTLADLLSNVEWTDAADLSQVRISRQSTAPGQDSPTLMVVHLDRYMQPDSGKSPDSTQNPTLQDKDAVFVPMKSRVAGGVFSITGQVTKPATGLPLRVNPALSLREAIAFAGGTLVDANRKRVTVSRAGQVQPIVVDLDRAEHGDVANNIEIHPDDAIFIERLVNTAFVVVDGAFIKPGTKIPFSGQLTLTQAIMEAGGPSPLAKEQQGMIIRHAGDGPSDTTLIGFKWKDILSKKAKDVALNAGDSVWMASSVPGPAKNPQQFMQYLAPLGYVLSAAGL